MQTEKLRGIIAGKIVGAEAATILRESLTEIRMAEELTRQYRAMVSAAEIFLIYGELGRAQESKSFIEGAG